MTITLLVSAGISESAGTGPEKIRMENLRIEGTTGVTPDEILTGKPVLISADLASAHGDDQNLTFVIEIQKEDGSYEPYRWLSLYLPGDESSSLGQPWYPSSPGLYTVRALAFESVSAAFPMGIEGSIDTSKVIGPILEIKARVSGDVLVYDILEDTEMLFENFEVADAFGNIPDEIRAGMQVHLAADITNTYDGVVSFVYLVQIQDEDGAYMRPFWLSGGLAKEQSFSAALSWTPKSPGIYTARAFVFDSAPGQTNPGEPVDSSQALAPVLEKDIVILPIMDKTVKDPFKVVLSNFAVHSMDVSDIVVGKPVNLAADITDKYGGNPSFTYLVQVRDEGGVTVHLSWNIVGDSILQWTPSKPGTYTATAFVWKSLENPVPLSMPAVTTITVS